MTDLTAELEIPGFIFADDLMVAEAGDRKGLAECGIGH